MTKPDRSQPQSKSSPFRYVHSPNFPALLQQLQLSLAVTTYQAGKLMLVRPTGNKLSLLLRSFEKPMGLAVSDDLDRMVLGARNTVWTLRAAAEIAPQLEPKGSHDACLVPRQAHVTGDIQGHEIALVDGRPWIVNTLFSCLCTLDPNGDYGFVPQWKPPFIDQLVGEDRCHLNGIAIEDGKVGYVSAMGETNTAGGWRDNKITGGVVLEVDSGEVVTRGLCMPHSPRVHDGKLFVLDSGRGLLCTVDERNGERTTVAALPGFARGLAFHGQYAFVGLSMIREKDQFGGMPIAEQFDDTQRKCGVCVVDLQTGQLTAFLWFEAGCSELFDIQTLPGLRFPSVIGFQDDTINGIMVAPKAAWLPGAELPVKVDR
tara:strand:- start:77745 stop:78863 length:1119 start_codon:yes stop_codon:yes gene_type:complete